MNSWMRDNRGFLGFLLFFGIFRTAIADWNPIPSPSMHPNLLEGDVVFVNRLAYNAKIPLADFIVVRTGEPRRGDIVTFTSPADGKRLIKRLVAVPGDTVEMRDERLIINGQPAEYNFHNDIDETHGSGRIGSGVVVEENIDDRRHLVQWMDARSPASDFGPVVVPGDHYLMLGDNRDNSADSRYIGFVPRRLLVGRAVRILVSADITTDWLPRFSRFGMPLD